MECVIRSIHPESKFSIHSKIDRKNLQDITFSIDTTDDKAVGCFILIQEAMRLKKDDN